MTSGRAGVMMSPRDVAAQLNVPLATVYRWNHMGDGPPRVRIGRHVRYRLEDVEAWVESQTVGTGPEAA